MANFTLSAKSPLARTSAVHEGCEVRQVRNLSVASVAAARGNQGAFAAAVAELGLSLPEAGMFATHGTRTIASTGYQQWFVCATDEPTLAADITTGLAGSGYATDQTGAWIDLRMSGPNSRDVLERMCALDLHQEAFAVGMCARTTMEHLGAQIALLDDTPTFSLMTPSSSSRSFWSALEHALASACGPSI